MRFWTGPVIKECTVITEPGREKDADLAAATVINADIAREMATCGLRL